MLYEDDVVDAVASFLETRGYTVLQTRTAMQHGVDLIAEKPGPPRIEVRIEAKGEGSSKPGTNRFGSTFTGGQALDHVAKAILKALQVVSEGDRTRLAGIALPRNSHHLRQVALVRDALLRVGVAIFWVDAERHVTVDSPWPV